MLQVKMCKDNPVEMTYAKTT